MSRTDSQASKAKKDLAEQGGVGAGAGAVAGPEVDATMDAAAAEQTEDAAVGVAEDAAEDVQWLTPTEQHVWRQWLDLGARINNAIGRELQRENNISLADYQVLVHLSEAEDYRQRIVALADEIKWERSRLSHQITRMAKRGLVRRESCEKDGRGAFVILEDYGLEVITTAAPGHVETVRHMMFDGLSEEQLAALQDALNHIEPQVADQEERTAAALAAQRAAKSRKS